MIPLVTIRPEPGFSATIERAREAELAIGGAPLFTVRPLDWEAPPAGDFDALLIGSANAFRHGGAALAQYRGLPVHAVGPATAQAAEAAGYRVERTGGGFLQGLVDIAQAPMRFLRLAGRDRVAVDVPPGVSITVRAVYESAPLEMPATIAEALRSEALVLLHSARAAQHFALECDRLAIPRNSIALATISKRVASAAGPGWRDVRHSERPDEAALLALAQVMCG